MDQQEQRGYGTGFWAAVICAGILLLPVLYLLMLGPLQILVPQETWDVVIQPLVLWDKYVGENPKWFFHAFERYMDWWLRAPPPFDGAV